METLIATATFGLEAVVARELEALGYEARVRRPGWLAFEGDTLAIARTNLWLRASDRVLVELSEFEADDFGNLFDRTKALEWERFLPPNASFPVRGRSVKSKLASVPACQRLVKKAIVDRLKSAHRVDTLPEDGAEFPIEVALLNDRASLAIDTSGAGLHKRGYRPVSAAAPLKETLAAGLILLSFWNRTRAFLDPFCGTGTLPIEAALIAMNLAPGRNRTFVSETWSGAFEKAYVEAREQAATLETEEAPAPIEGSDIDAEALGTARASAERAGVDRHVHFEKRDFETIRPSQSGGCIVTNPPYGDRSGTEESVRALYQSAPNVLRRFPTWSHYILTSHHDFEKLIGQTADKRRKLYNGRIECTLYQFVGPRPGSERGTASFGGLDPKGEEQMELFRNRLKKRAHHLRKWPTKRGIDAYRIYDRDIKEVPVSVDRYADRWVVTPAVERSKTRTDAEHADWLDSARDVVADVMQTEREYVRIAGREREPQSVIVQEDGLSFEVRLGASRDSGLALEGRQLRRRVRDISKNQSVVCWPSAHGTYAVAALSGGAREVVLVVEPGASAETAEPDSVATAGVDGDRAWCERNLTLNHFTSERYRFQAGLEDMPAGLIVMESPSENAVERVLALARKGTEIYILTHATSRIANATEVTKELLPEDFRSRRRVRLWRVSR